MITQRRHRETWQQREDRYRCQQEDRRREEERHRQEWNQHKDHWNYPFFIHCWEQNIKLPTIRNCPECNGYDRYDRPNQQYENNDRHFDGPIWGRNLVHDRLGAGSVCMTSLVTMSGIFLETKRSLRRWQMHEFPKCSYFAEMLIPIEWSQGKIIANR